MKEEKHSKIIRIPINTCTNKYLKTVSMQIMAIRDGFVVSVQICTELTYLHAYIDRCIDRKDI